MVQNFNSESEKPSFTYKRNPLIENAFQIFQWKEDKGDYEPVGDYTLIDTSEAPELTEKTVMNLVASLNGRKDRILNLQNLTSGRIFFNIVNENELDESDHIIIMLRTQNNGVSNENAVLKIEKGVFDVREESHSS